MRYRLLEASEWDRLKSIVDPQFIPSPASAAAAVAEDESGVIVGVLFLQLAMHMEPLVLKGPMVSFERLHAVLAGAIECHKGLHIFVFSDKEIVHRMASYVGMKELPYKVFEEVF